MPFTKPSGSHSQRHFSSLQKVRHRSKSSTRFSFFGTLEPSALMEFCAQIVGKFSTATKLSLVLANVSALIKPFGSLGTDTAAETAYTQNQRSRLSLSEARISESSQSSHLLWLLSFLPS
jgi:hypothetical protein